MSIDNCTKVLLIAPLPPPIGGIAIGTEMLLNRVRRLPDISVEIVDSAVRWRQVTQLNKLIRLSGGALQAIGIYRQVAGVLATSRPHVVHITTSGGPAFLRDFLILRLLRRSNIPAVLSVHMGRLPQILKTKSTENWLARAAMAEASRVAVLDAASLKALDPDSVNEKYRIQPNFIDIDEVRQSIENAPLGKEYRSDVVFVGWVLRTKGVTELVRACASTPGLRLRLVGPIQRKYRRFLMKLASEGGMDLTITGELPRQEALKTIACSRALALPSYSEGFPNVILEAMAFGKPVIATAVGAIPDMLNFGTDEPCGFRVEVRDETSLAAAARDLIQHPQAWAIFGERGLRRVQANYSAQKHVDNCVGLWKSIVRPNETLSQCS